MDQPRPLGNALLSLLLRLSVSPLAAYRGLLAVVVTGAGGGSWGVRRDVHVLRVVREVRLAPVALLPLRRRVPVVHLLVHRPLPRVVGPESGRVPVVVSLSRLLLVQARLLQLMVRPSARRRSSRAVVVVPRVQRVVAVTFLLVVVPTEVAPVVVGHQRELQPLLPFRPRQPNEVRRVPAQRATGARKSPVRAADRRASPDSLTSRPSADSRFRPFLPPSANAVERRPGEGRLLAVVTHVPRRGPRAPLVLHGPL